MTEQPAAEYLAYLEATWEPATPCEFHGHERGAAGCQPDMHATWIVESLHLSCYDGLALPVRRPQRFMFACAGRIVAIRSRANQPQWCVCGFRGTLTDFLNLIPIIPPKPATLDS